jgi:hypothetical protein
VDVDVRRDQRGTGCGIILLTVLGGLGLAYGLVFPGALVISALAGNVDALWVLWPTWALLVFLAVAGGITTIRRSRAAVDVDVRHLQRRMGWRIITLALLGGLALAYGLIDHSPNGDRVGLPLLVLLICLAAASAITLRVYYRAQPPAGAQGVGRGFLNTLALHGAVMVGWCLLALAAFIILGVVCERSIGPFH